MGIDPFTGAVIGGIGSALIGSRSARRASDAQVSSSNAGIAEQRRQFEVMRELNQPFIEAGTNSVNELSRLFGYPVTTNTPVPTPQPGWMPSGRRGYGRFAPAYLARLQNQGGGNALADPDLPTGMDVFEASPDYQFRRDEGLEGIAQTLGAGGAGAFSGNALRGLNEFNSNLASGEFDNFVQRRLALAGLGGANTRQTGSAAINTGMNVANLLSNSGNARASGILGQGLAVNQGMNGILNALLLRNMGLAGGGGGSGYAGVPT